MGLFFAFGACATTAGAAILQSLGAHRVPRYARLDVRLLLALLRSGPYLAGLGLDAVSFVLTLLALRTTPLFVVQAIVAAAIALIAASSIPLHDRRLTPAEWTAVAAVCLGVSLLVVAESPREATSLSPVGLWSLLAAPVAVAVIAALAVRSGTGAAFPGLLAGLMFGDSAVAARVVTRATEFPGGVLRSPVPFALLLAGIMGTLLYASALQRGSVTAASAMSIVGQTLGPAITGWFLLGDSIRTGLLWAALTGFILTVGAALTLAHHAHPPPLREPEPPDGEEGAEDRTQDDGL